MIIDQIIREAQNYETMFSDIVKADTDPRLQQEIMRDINWARKILRKNDRIIWFLRWSKIWYQLSGGIWAGGRADTSLSGALQQYNQRFQTRYVAGDLRSPPVMKTQLEHFLSLPIPEIQNYVFRTESPRQLFELFTKYEAAWRQRIEEEKSLITPEPEDEILISFADGYAWWLLPRGGCRVEAEAMGHCGNVPSQRPGDQILSLRRQVRLDLRSRATPQGGLRGEAPTEGSTRGDVIRWYPVATFILDDDGKLGEMKGRGNDKPAAKYHPYIVELLRHHLIRGIKGGGYMPENNFSISDLDPQTREQLIATKQELKGLLGYYEEEGMTERVLDMLETRLHERDLPDYERFEESASTADLFEIIRTTRSMRRLKPDPVPNELIRKILEAGVCAPSGGNMQRWRFLLISDPKIKETIGALYKRAWDEQVAPRYRAGDAAARRGRIFGRSHS